MTTSAQKDFLISHIVDKLTEFLLLDNDMELADALNVVYHSRDDSWTMKKVEWQKVDAFELWCWRRLLSVPWTERSNQ